MNKHLRRLAWDYAATLRKYQADVPEVALAHAYDLGRAAIARGMGVLDMARVYMQTIEQLLPGNGASAELKAAGTIFLESLSPFEATHRGFRETNQQLRQLIATLEVRNLELAETNRNLAAEIRQRKRTERALQSSEEHYRQLFNEAQAMQERLRNLSNHVLHAQEEERRRISRELHDQVGQALMAISVTLAGLKQACARNDGTASRKLADAQRLLQEMMETVHDFARKLRPAMLDELGLLPALRTYLKDFARRTGLSVHFRGSAQAEALDGEQKTVLYRVAQESLTNVAKHAHADRVEITLHKVGHGICMEIADNGRSFRENAKNLSKRKKRLGLLGMQERVRLVNGKFAVRPLPGKGTTVHVAMPLNSNGGSGPSHPVRAELTRHKPLLRVPSGAPARKY